ncbi:MAG: hypothetical protein CMJ54_01625 [Planctomycetaceae bacterium]|nr:hypothetical protein [Planctomycetaceae bacterium]
MTENGKVDHRMESARDLLRDLQGRGVRFSTFGTRIHHAAPQGSLDASARRRLTELHEQVLQNLLEDHPHDGIARPLSRTQRRFRIADGGAGTDPGDHVRIIHRLRGPVDLDAMESALQEIVVRHAGLRTRFESDGTKTFQRTLPPHRFKIVRRSMIGETREVIDTCIEECIAKSFDVKSGGLFRVMVIEAAPEDHVMVIVSHHLMLDGWSVSLLLEELTDLYEKCRAGKHERRESNPGRFNDYVERMAKWEDSDACREQLDRWRSEIEPGLTATVLPADENRHERRPLSFGEVDLTVTNRVASDLFARGRQWRAGSLAIINAVIACLLARASGETRITTGLALTNRRRADFERVIANFANESVIHLAIDPGQRFSVVLRRMKTAIRRATDRLDTPFDKVADALSMKRIGSRRLVMPVFVSLYELQQEGTLRIKDLTVERVPASHVNPFQQIGIRTVIGTDSVRFKIEYDETLFRRERIEALLDNLVSMLERILEDPETIVADLPFDPILAEGVGTPAILQSGPRPRHAEPGNLLETRLAEVWTEILGVHPIGRSDDFFDLGGSSLMAIQLIERVHQVFGAHLGLDVLLSEPTLAKVAARIEKSGRHIEIDRSVWITADRGRPITFCLPGIGGLAAFTYRDIGHCLEGRVSLVGLQLRGLDGREEPDDRIEKMASTMLDEILAIQPTGPHHLCGYSLGGTIAIEVARLIQKSGGTVGSLLLLDTYPPNFFSLQHRLLRRVKRTITRRLFRKAGLGHDRLQVVLPEDDPAIAALPKAGRLGNAIRDTFATTQDAYARHRPEKYVGNVDIVASIEDPAARSSSETRFVSEWKKLIDGELRLHPIPVSHLDLVRKGQERIAKIMTHLVLMKPEEAE